MSSKAAAEHETEAYSEYVEVLGDARTPLAAAFNVLVYSSSSSSASRASCRFCSSIALCKSMRMNME